MPHTPNALTLASLGNSAAPNLPNPFRALSSNYGTPVPTAGMPQPHWIASSAAVARELGLGEEWQSHAGMLDVLSANLPRELPSSQGPRTWASVYSGHQFGHWAGQLGDGRAHALGCLTDVHGHTQELQYKGAGRTPYSRMGDGRAVLRSSIREFLASEAMAALGVPTTRALALVGSDLPVAREEMETAAIVTRVAPSFIRFGHFEHWAARRDEHHLRRLVEFVVDEHLPACREQAARYQGNLATSLLAEVTRRTADLFARFQATGFCHGVLNTDNMSILGLSIDYGPFQFMDGFNPDHISNHSDTGGRYSYKNQPSVAYWNLFCLAQALMPLIDDEQLALSALEPFQAQFSQALAQQMAAKLGLPDAQADDGALTQDLLQLLARERTDWPVFWRRLSYAVQRNFAPPASVTELHHPTQADVAELFAGKPGQSDFAAWLARYAQRLPTDTRASSAQTMLRTNPEYALRNHLCEEAIAKAKLKDFSGVTQLLARVQAPFDPLTGAEAYSAPAPDWAANICISCSS